MKQTAVEWLLSELEKYDHPTQAMIFYAKKLEKQQIVEAYSEADVFPQSYLHGEDYYEQTYKNEK